MNIKDIEVAFCLLIIIAVIFSMLIGCTHIAVQQERTAIVAPRPNYSPIAQIVNSAGYHLTISALELNKITELNVGEIKTIYLAKDRHIPKSILLKITAWDNGFPVGSTSKQIKIYQANNQTSVVLVWEIRKIDLEY